MLERIAWHFGCTFARLVQAALKKPSIDPRDLPPIERVTLLRILRYIKPYRWRAAAIVLCIVLGSVLNLAPAWLVKRIVDDAIPRGDLPLLWLCCAGMVAAPLAAALLQMVQKYGAETVGQAVMFDLRVALYRRFQDMPFAFFTKQKPGEAVSHVLNDVQGVGSAVSGTLVDIVQNSLVLASTVAFVFALDWRLALVAVAFLPAFIAPARRVGRTRKALKRTVQTRMAELTGILTETLSVSGALLVKTFGGSDAEHERFRGKAEEIRRLSLQQSLVGRTFRLLLGLFETVGPAVVFALGGWLAIRGEVPLGTLVAFVAVMKRLYSPATELAGVHVDLMTSYAYFERVFAVVDRTDVTLEDQRPSAAGSLASGSMQFRNVSFSYDGADLALSGVDLTIRAGMKVGIVGPSGAGKSTLASLVVRLHDATAGTVLFDNVDVQRIDLASLRANVAVVAQETFLFHTTVLDNLRYGRPSATRAEVEAAAGCARIHDLIAALPDGYDTIVGERGYRFSAGERQRLAIARAIVRNPPVLILDEATSALDPICEREIIDSLAGLLESRTTLIISHRLATVRDADLLVVMNQGRIVERGTHDALIAAGGLYSWLWRSQARRDARHALSAGA